MAGITLAERSLNIASFVRNDLRFLSIDLFGSALRSLTLTRRPQALSLSLSTSMF